MLTNSAPVSLEGGRDRFRQRVCPLAELRRGLGPRLTVAWKPVRAELGTERDQRGEVGHGLHRSGLRHPHEPVRVEVVAEQERRVSVLGREQPRPPVVEQVALVDRLQAEPVELLGERREDRLTVALVLRAESVEPEPALGRRLLRDRLPEVRGYNQAASSLVQ
jgi:hypothetical protein